MADVGKGDQNILRAWDLLGGPAARTPCSQCKRAQVPSLVRKLDPMCHS